MILKNSSRLPRISVAATFTFLASSSLLLAADEDAGQSNALKKYILDGGPTMLFIGLAVVALIALCVFNFINLTKNKFSPDDLRAALLEHMTACRARSAIELAASHPSYLGRMIAYSLPNLSLIHI